MQATRILLVRHGETDWNRDARVQGHEDIALNAAGRRQARCLAAALAAADPIDAVFSSDLARALETARPCAEAIGAPLQPTPALRERHFGLYQGRRFVDVRAEQPAQAERWRRRDPDWAPPGGGESLQQFRDRIVPAVQALAARHLDRHIAVFTHGGALDVLYRAATGLGLQDARTWQLGNAAINRLLWTPDGGFALVGWADTLHLVQHALDETLA
ncbi:MAG TPA: histidine phosphatase family protein [Ottowia sp.]|uniref:histidine phosphatase family protein n=1 Tax=Ottowia sp. TaxID=1898956 RepID=UPI002C73289E|nr:histidine phosphatase family protein [Ottowia sp.]HMN20079.1 histidine phosphatase family protein [Ottowia sp.]